MKCIAFGILVGAIAIAMGSTSLAQSVVTGTSVATGPTGTTTTVTTSNGPAAASAQAAAQSAEISAQNSAFTASGITPGVTAGTNAGTEEANLLASVAINAAAEQILTRLKNNDGHTVLIVAGNTGLDLSAWMTYRDKLQLITTELTKDLQTYNNLTHPAPARPRARGGEAALGFGEAVGVGANELGKLISYFATNYQISGVSVTTTDYMLAVAIASRSVKTSIIYSQALSLGAGHAVMQEFSQLAALAANANGAITSGNPLTAKQKKQQPTRSASIDAAVTQLKGDLSDYSNFNAWLLGGVVGTTATTANIGPVVQEYAAGRVLDAGGGVLYVQIHSAAGGLISKTNLWSTLGAMPLYASGGVVVSFTYYAKVAAPKPGEPADARGDLIKAITASDNPDPDLYPMQAAGLFGVVLPYRTIGHVAHVVELDKTMQCDAESRMHVPSDVMPTATTISTDASTYCPR